MVAISAGGMHAVSLDANGQVYSWGCDDEHALGRDTTAPTNESSDSSDGEDLPGLSPIEATPTVVTISPHAPRIVQVAAGDSCTFALADDGLVFGCGTFRNRNGAYGFTFDPTAATMTKYQKTPLLVPGLRRITQICAGADFALALDADNQVYGWGPNESGETGYRLLGRRHHSEEVLLPHLVALPRPKIISVHAGLNHAFAINAIGNVWAWVIDAKGI